MDIEEQYYYGDISSKWVDLAYDTFTILLSFASDFFNFLYNFFFYSFNQQLFFLCHSNLQLLFFQHYLIFIIFFYSFYPICSSTQTVFSSHTLVSYMF